jgi:zinc protease
MAVSYLRHPYRNPILGWPTTWRGSASDDLRAFYRAHYRPDGAVLVVVGDVEPEAALDRVAAHFESMAPGDSPRVEPTSHEPRQTGRRDFALVESEAVARGILGWHTVPQGHPDGPALDVASDLLTCGRRSRLWDDLVERGRVATWVETAQEGARRAGQFLVQVEAVPGVETSRIEGAIAATLARLADEGPSTEELARSRHRLEAAWRWEQEDLAGLASGLGHVALWDDWRAWQDEHRAAIAVEADDVRRVVSTYLTDSNLTVGWSLPRPGRGATVLLPTERSLPRRRRPVRPRRGASSARSRCRCRTASRGSPTSARIARPSPTA